MRSKEGRSETASSIGHWSVSKGLLLTVSCCIWLLSHSSATLANYCQLAATNLCTLPFKRPVWLGPGILVDQSISKHLKAFHADLNQTCLTCQTRSGPDQTRRGQHLQMPCKVAAPEAALPTSPSPSARINLSFCRRCECLSAQSAQRAGSVGNLHSFFAGLVRGVSNCRKG